MRFMLLIHQGDTPTPDDPDAWSRLTPDEQQAVWADYRAVAETPGVTTGERMAAPAVAKTVRVEEGRPVVTDGPFAETREALGGYLFVEAHGPEAALALAARIPAARLGGAVEVRPLVG